MASRDVFLQNSSSPPGNVTRAKETKVCQKLLPHSSFAFGILGFPGEVNHRPPGHQEGHHCLKEHIKAGSFSKGSCGWCEGAREEQVAEPGWVLRGHCRHLSGGGKERQHPQTGSRERWGAGTPSCYAPNPAECSWTPSIRRATGPQKCVPLKTHCGDLIKVTELPFKQAAIVQGSFAVDATIFIIQFALQKTIPPSRERKGYVPKGSCRDPI